MRVGLNATCFSDRPSGARQRFVGIYGALIRRCPDIQFLIYEPADYAVSAWFAAAPNVRAIRMPVASAGRLGRAWRQWRHWPSRLAADELDLFEQYNLPLVRSPCPTILTIHDVRSTRADSGQPGRAIARMIHRQALVRADAVITVSDTMKRELLALEPSARVTTIYNGIDPTRFAAPCDPAATLARHGLAHGYLLAVGHLEARKNYTTLIDAMSAMRLARPDLSLLIVGEDGGERAALARQISAVGLAGAVTLLSGISDDELANLYRAAALVVFPSRYEGFGIPLLEAMATRRPVATSDIPVFVELSEGQGVTFPPDDPAAIAATLLALLANPARQQQLIAYGERRLADFDFNRLATEVEQLYRSLVVARVGN